MAEMFLHLFKDGVYFSFVWIWDHWAIIKVTDWQLNINIIFSSDDVEMYNRSKENNGRTQIIHKYPGGKTTWLNVDLPNVEYLR